jgi:hypothetical protein
MIGVHWVKGGPLAAAAKGPHTNEIVELVFIVRFATKIMLILLDI